MNSPLRERLNSMYAAFRFGNVNFLLNAFDEDIEFVSYSPQGAFPFLGHHRGKSVMTNVLKAGYAEFVTYESCGISGPDHSHRARRCDYCECAGLTGCDCGNKSIHKLPEELALRFIVPIRLADGAAVAAQRLKRAARR